MWPETSGADEERVLCQLQIKSLSVVEWKVTRSFGCLQPRVHYQTFSCSTAYRPHTTHEDDLFGSVYCVIIHHIVEKR